jgi:thiol-disulfide isomerase/thioredoxin
MKPSLRHLTFLVVATALIFVTGTHSANAQGSADAANIYRFPKPYQCGDVVLKTPTGQTVSLKDYRGRVVLLHFWSINCPACRVEEPSLETLKRTFGPQGLEILAVNLVDPPQAIAQHAATKRTPFPVLFDGGRGFSLKVVEMGGRRTSFLINPGKEAILEVPGFPTTYVIDCRGNVVAYSIGAAGWGQSSAQSLIRNLVVQSKTCRPGPAAGKQYSMSGSAWAGPRRGDN